MKPKLLSTVLSAAACALVAMTYPAAFASLPGGTTTAPSSAERLVEVAQRKGADERKEPERGSSAQLYGGSSADRYGSSSADRSGVGGQRDGRLYRKPSTEKWRPKVEDDQAQDEEEE